MSAKLPARSEQSNDNTQPPAKERLLGPTTASNVISFLYDRVHDLDVEDLRFLSEATGCASHMAYNVGQSISDIGCVINADYTPGESRAGNFEDGNNVSSLLFVIADQIKVISELTQIGDDA